MKRPFGLGSPDRPARGGAKVWARDYIYTMYSTTAKRASGEEHRTSNPQVHLCRAVCHHVEHSVDCDHCKGIGSDGSGVCA